MLTFSTRAYIDPPCFLIHRVRSTWDDGGVSVVTELASGVRPTLSPLLSVQDAVLAQDESSVRPLSSYLDELPLDDVEHEAWTPRGWYLN